MPATHATAIPSVQRSRAPNRKFDAIAARERLTEAYWSRRDPINEDRLFWRAQTVRHTFHVLPGQSILELGCGSGRLTSALVAATRGECPITAASFSRFNHAGLTSLDREVELIVLDSFPGELRGRTFDYIVASNVLDLGNTAWMLKETQHLLRPGGRLLFFEANPWNPVFQIRRLASKWIPFCHDAGYRALPTQIHLYELMSELGFVRVATSCYDFLYPPIPRWLMRAARNLSLILENTPIVRNMAGAILVQGQRPPCDLPRPAVSMDEHEELFDAVSVVVPCHNEEMNLEPLVEGLLKHYNRYIHEIVLVDDNSVDGTRAVLERLVGREPRVHPVIRTPPGGVGLALRDGLQAANGRLILTMDCDFLHILPELREMFDAAAKGADVVLGSRFSRESVLINYPIQKIVCNRTFHLLASLLFWRRLRDMTNNLKLLKREVVDNLQLESFRFAANAETGLKPLLMGFAVQAVPISWINRSPEMGQSSFSLLKNGLGYATVLASLAWQTGLGRRQLTRRATRQQSQ
jgi:SAM-dependent methyltransferase